MFWVSLHKQPPRTLAQTLARLSGYYELSLFNSCSLNAPDNDKAPRCLTASLLTLRLLSLSASRSLAPLYSALCLLYDTQGQFDGIPSHHLNIPIHLQVKKKKKNPARKARNTNFNCGERTICTEPWNARQCSPLTSNIKRAPMGDGADGIGGGDSGDIRCHNLASLRPCVSEPSICLTFIRESGPSRAHILSLHFFSLSPGLPWQWLLQRVLGVCVHACLCVCVFVCVTVWGMEAVRRRQIVRLPLGAFT